MKYRKLRMAWSVGWGVVAMLLVALWVRSYWWGDIFDLQVAESRRLHIRSTSGMLYFASTYDTSTRYAPGHWRLSSSDHSVYRNELWEWFPFHCQSLWDETVIAFPHWAAAIAAGVIAAVGYFKQKFAFSLRTLLIVTALVAVVMGLIVWAIR